VVGSHVANIGIILGLAAVIRTMSVKARIVCLDAPLMTLAAVCLAALVVDGIVSRP